MRWSRRVGENKELFVKEESEHDRRGIEARRGRERMETKARLSRKRENECQVSEEERERELIREKESRHEIRQFDYVQDVQKPIAISKRVRP